MKHVYAIFIILLLSACAPKINYTINYAQEASKIELGMSKQQVIALLGVPRKTSKRKFKDSVIEHLSYWSETRIGFSTFSNEMMASDRVTVILTDGKVTEYGDLLLNPDRTLDRITNSTSEIMQSTLPQEVNVNVNVEK